MAYFAAVLARASDSWSVHDSDLDEFDDLDSLTEYLRKRAVDDEPVLLLIEQEDMWFAVVRVDGEDDPRVFVSDAAAVARSSYGEVLLADLDLDTAPDDSESADFADADEEEDEEPSGYPAAEPAGDSEVLADLGTPAADLLDMCGGGVLPTDVLTTIAERAGCADELESVR